MGGRRQMVVLALLASCGCGLVDGDDQVLALCAEVGGRRPDYAVTTRVREDIDLVSTLATSYTKEGWVLREMRDDDDDSKPESERLLSLDDSGNVLEDAYFNEDGVEGPTTVYEYDEDGRRARGETFVNEGETLSVLTWDYSVPGREVQRQDSGADGTTDSVITSFYTAEGYLARTEVDQDVDGAPELVDEYTYEGDGLLVRESTDVGGDGILEIVWTHTYDEDTGKMLSSHLASIRNDGSVSERLATLVYDDAGLLKEMETDLQNDGSVDIVDRWIYDQKARVVRQSASSDGRTQYVTTYEYGSGAEPLTTMTDWGLDGTWDFLETRITCAQ